MNILILSQYYPPETGAPQNRLHDFSKRMNFAGNTVEVLTAIPNYPHSKIYTGYENKISHSEVIDGILVHRLWLFIPKSRSILMRLLNYLSFAFHCIFRGWRQLKNKPDIIFMESPPLFLGLAGVFLAKIFGANLVTNISDLWPKSLVDAGYVKRGVAVRLCEWLELKIYRLSAGITGQTEGILDFIRTLVPQKPMHLYPNGMDLESMKAISIVECGEIRKKYGWAETDIVVGYTGVLGYSQALDQIVEATHDLPSVSSVKFALFGEGPEKQRLEEYIKNHPDLKVQICGHTTRDEILKIQQAIDIAIVPLSKADIFKGARPSKMFEYMAASKPIIYCGSGEGAEILRSPEGVAGVVVEAEAPKALSKAVLELAGSQCIREEMGLIGRKIVVERFSRSKIATDLMLFMQNLPKVNRISLRRRVFDIFLSSLGLFILSPLFVLVSILIKFESRGPIFYRQKRVGLYGKEFNLIKFRSMRVNSDQSGLITQGLSDSRITRLGLILRKYRIDEFPQLFNVLFGDMSFVGPRPEVKYFVEKYNKDQLRILNVKPGITDYAGLDFLDLEEKILEAHPHNMDEIYIREILPKKIEINKKHLEPASLKSDLGFMVKTIVKTFDWTRT